MLRGMKIDGGNLELKKGKPQLRGLPFLPLLLLGCGIQLNRHVASKLHHACTIQLSGIVLLDDLGSFLH